MRLQDLFETRKAVAEATGDKPFDNMMKGIVKGTKKQAAADRREQKKQDQERARAAFGPNPADKLSIRKPGVAEGVMSEIDLELREIVANQDFDALYNLFSANTPAGRYVQNIYNDVAIDHRLHPDDDFERIEKLVFDRLEDQFGEQGVAEGSVEEGVIDKVRAMNYDRLAKRSDKKVQTAFDKMQDFDFADPERFPHEKEFSDQMDKMGQRTKKANQLRTEQGVAEGEGSKSSPYEQGGTDAWYHRGFDPKAHGYKPGTEEYREYKRGFDQNDFGPEGGKQYVEELTVPAAVKGAGKVIGKKLPLVAVPLGAYDAYERAKAGDIAGAGLAAGSMIGGIPHPLTIGASLGLDAIQALRDKARTGEYLPDYEKIAAAVAKDQAKQTAMPADKWSDVPTDKWQAKDDKSDIIVHSPIKIGTDDEDDEDEALIDKNLKENSELDRIRYYVKYTG